jgi:hypothetical protein
VKLVIALVVLGACSGAPTTNSTKPGGTPLLWQTEALPWHLPHAVLAFAVNGDTALCGGGSWLFQVDLRTGKTVREARTGARSITAIAHISGDRWVVAGVGPGRLGEGAALAYAVNGTTLESTEIKLQKRDKDGFQPYPRVAVLKDGGVVITGQRQPLAIYDPASWTLRSVLDERTGWGDVSVRGDVLVATRDLREVMRFDVGTNGRRLLASGSAARALAGDGVEIVAQDDEVGVYVEGRRTHTLRTKLKSLTVDESGKQLIATAPGELRIYKLPTGELVKTIKLGSENMPLAGTLVATGKHVRLVSDGVLRTIDVQAGTITPTTAEPLQSYWLAIANDGRVLAANETVYTLANGKVTASSALADGASMETVRNDDPTRYLTVSDDGKTIHLHTIGDKAPKTWTLDEGGRSYEMWIARDGRVVIESETENGRRIVTTRGAKLEPIYPFNPDASVIAVDPDDDALVAIDGRVAVIGLDGKLRSTIRVPHCEATLAFGVAEPGGTRAITNDDMQLALWDRKTGALLANIDTAMPEDIVFIPGRPEILLNFDDRVVAWTPTKGTRTLSYAGVIEPAVSADGKRLALAFYDGRIAVFDLPALLAAAPLGPDLPAGEDIPDRCGETDPLIVPPKTSDDDDAPDDDPGD